ncbi:MAG: hypothetical protein AAF655_12030 [Bacteroidota bacterium]
MTPADIEKAIRDTGSVEQAAEKIMELINELRRERDDLAAANQSLEFTQQKHLKKIRLLEADLAKLKEG